MKRLWLSLCLASLVIIMGGLGIYREAGVRLSHALERFRTALPIEASFHYRKVRPALLLGGITLYDVSFRYKDTAFQARRIRFGYPKLLSNGTLSLASLRLEAPSYTNHTHHITATQANFHHLLIPSSAETLHEGHDEADSMHSLVAIMSFEPEDITSLRFEHMALDHLSVNSLPTAASQESPTPNRPFTIHALSADNLIVEGYGKGVRVHTLMEGVSLDVRFPGGNNGTIPPILRQILLPTQNGTIPQAETPFAAHLALQHLEARQGYIQWLKHPSRQEEKPAEAFWQDPAAPLWEKPGKMEITGLSLILNQADHRRTISLAHLTGERRDDKNSLHTEADLQGLTTQLAPPPSLNIATITMPGNYHINTTSRLEMGSWRETLQLRTLFGADSPTLMTMELNLPEINPLHLTNDNAARFLHAGQCLSTELSVQGTDFFSYYGLLSDRPSTSSPTNEATALPTQNKAISSRFNALALQRPILAPVLDFLLSPKSRTLTIKTGPLSLEELAHIATDNTDESRFDRLHVLSVTTQELQ
ncbi:hypothetical protein BG621_05635 [Parasaccharibacter apium]|nr:hypothetical protein BG621_05635 [Parasaccharibacter apium]